MNQIEYTPEKMQKIHDQVIRLVQIVSELEEEFPGRPFTLDGHLVGSIGEVMASYYYGIDLYPPSKECHDGTVNGRKVQIKITQREDIVICREPDYLIVMYLRRDGNVYEVYNGPGKKPWENAGKPDSHNNRHIRLNKLMELDKCVDEPDRIHPLCNRSIPKMRNEYKNQK